MPSLQGSKLLTPHTPLKTQLFFLLGHMSVLPPLSASFSKSLTAHSTWNLPCYGFRITADYLEALDKEVRDRVASEMALMDFTGVCDVILCLEWLMSVCHLSRTPLLLFSQRG